MRGIREAFERITYRWPFIGFASLAILFCLLDVYASANALFGSDDAFVLPFDYYDATKLSWGLFIVVGAFFAKRLERTFNLRFVYVVATVVLTAGMMLLPLVHTGALPTEACLLTALVVGICVGWLLVGNVMTYERLSFVDTFVYVAGARIVGTALYFVLESLAPIALVVTLACLAPLVTILLYEKLQHALPGGACTENGEAAPSPVTDKLDLLSFRNTAERYDHDFWRSRRLIFKISLFVLIVSALNPLKEMEGANALFAIDNVRVITIVVLTALVLAVIMRPENKNAILVQGWYLTAFALFAFFVASPFLTQDTIAILWITKALRVVSDTLLLVLCCILAKGMGAYGSQLYAFLCMPRVFGGFLGLLLGNAIRQASDAVATYIVLGVGLVCAVLLFNIIQPATLKRLEALIELGDEESLDTKATPPSGEAARRRKGETDASSISGNGTAEALLAESIGLSHREAEVFMLLVKGYTTNLIAQDLFISKSTVKTHVAKIYLKAGVASREEFFIWHREACGRKDAFPSSNGR